MPLRTILPVVLIQNSRDNIGGLLAFRSKLGCASPSTEQLGCHLICRSVAALALQREDVAVPLARLGML